MGSSTWLLGGGGRQDVIVLWSMKSYGCEWVWLKFYMPSPWQLEVILLVHVSLADVGVAHSWCCVDLGFWEYSSRVVMQSVRWRNSSHLGFREG